MAQGGVLPLDPDLLPTLNGVSQEPAKHGPITSGLVRFAADTLGGGAGAVLAGAGKLFNSPTVEQAGNSVEQAAAAAAPSFNRPDLDVAPWQAGGAHVVPWAEYQVAKTLPLLGLFAAGGRGLAAAGVEAPAAAQGLAARLPRVLGGGGLRAGMNDAEATAAAEAGRKFSQTALGATAVGTPLGFGQLYQEAQQKPGGATRDDAVRALALAPVMGASMAITAPEFTGLASRGLVGGIAKRIIAGGLTGAATGAIQSGVQTAILQSMRPDLTPQEKFDRIVEATAGGSAIGGILGGGAGAVGGNHGVLREVKQVDPASFETPDIKNVVDQVLGLPAPHQVSSSSAAAPRPGEGFTATEPLEQGPSFDAVQKPARPYKKISTDELAAGLAAARKRIEANKSDEAINNFVEAAHQELQLRNGAAIETNVDQPTVETVEPNLTEQSGGKVRDSGAPVSATSQFNGAELTQGLRLPARLKAAVEGAANAGEAQDIIHDHVIIQNKSGKNVDALAQRAGVLDSDGRPTALASQISERAPGSTGEAPVADTTATTEPAAPANREGGDQLAPAKMDNRQLLEALAANNPKEIEADLPAVAAAALTDTEPKFDLKQRINDSVQQEAVRRGLLEKTNGVFDYSTKARDMMQRNYNEPIPTADTAAAADTRGFKGADASQFDRGAQAFVRGVKFQQLAEPAWKAGHKWAEDLSAPPITHEATQQMIANLNVGDTERQSITHDEKQTGEFNRQIDDLQLSPTVHPTEIAQLKQMVSNRAPASEIHDALNAVRSGQPLIPISLVEPKPFKGERVTRGLLNAKQVADRQQAIREGEAAQSPQKQALTALTQKHQLLRDEVRGAFQSGDLTRREFIGLTAKLQQGKYDDVVAGLPGRAKERIGDATDTGMTSAEAQKTVDGITGAWKSKNNVEVHQSAADLPENLRSQLSSDGTKGLFDSATGTLHIIAGNHTDPADLSATVYHEVLGHNGLTQAFGNKLGDLLDGIYRTNKGVRDLADEYLDATGKWQNVPDAVRHRNAVNEVLAEGSEGGVIKASVWEKVTHMIRNFGRQMGLNLKYNAADVQAIIARAHSAITDGTSISEPVANTGAPQINERVSETVRGAVDKVDELVAKADPMTKGRKAFLYFAGENSVAQKLGKLFDYQGRNGLREHIEAQDRRGPMGSMFAKGANDIHDQAAGLKRIDPKAHADINKLVALTADGINPFRDWDQQSGAVKANPENREALTKAVALLRSLQTRDVAAKSNMRVGLYTDMRAVNDSSMLRAFANQIHKMVTANPLSADKIVGFEQHPVDTLMDRATRETFDLNQTHQFWDATVKSQLDAVDAFNKLQRGHADNPATPEDESKAINGHVSDLEQLSAQIKEGIARLEAGPNFSLGRTGDYFVDMKLKTGADGAVDRAALTRAAEHLAEFGKVIPLNSTADHIYMRVETPSAQASLMKKAAELQKMGVIRKNDEKPAIVAGKRGDVRMSSAISPWIAKYEASIKANSTFSDETKEALIKELHSTTLDGMTDNAIAKFMAPRDNVLGFNADMIGSFLTRNKAANDAMVGQVTAPKTAAAYVQMEAARKAAQGASISDVPLEHRAAITDVIKEWRNRDAARVDYSQTPLVDAMRRVTNFFGLGGTIAYPIIQLTQLPMVALPKLGSKYGFVKSAKTIGNVTPEAIRIMKAVFQLGVDAPGLSNLQKGARAANVEVSLEALKKAGITGRTAEYLMHLVNANQLGTGSQAHVLSSSVTGNRDGAFNHTMQYAAGMGYYAETLTRVITALAHLKLNPEMSAVEASAGGVQLLKDSMFDFHMDAQGRAFGKNGMFGTKTPLMTQFMTYQSQLIQRLYLETHDAFKGETPESQRAARAFLMQHAAMATMFAGTLGLPFATAFAAAYNTLNDKLDPGSEPSNIQADYRNYLADMFGKDVGELIAEGGFRVAGVDVSSRIGEQDILPFSRFLADRRALKDQLKDLESRSWGAPANMAANAFEGAQKLSEGDVMGGLISMMPAAFANPTKAYRMTQDGYVDTKGTKLPIATPSVEATMVQLMGFTPAPMAEYREANYDASTRKGLIVRQASNIRNQLADAILGGDKASARDLLGQASQFDQTHPAFAVLPSIEGTIRQRAKQQAIAKATTSPLGVSIKDLAGQQATRYANVDYAAQ